MIARWPGKVSRCQIPIPYPYGWCLSTPKFFVPSLKLLQLQLLNLAWWPTMTMQRISGLNPFPRPTWGPGRGTRAQIFETYIAINTHGPPESVPRGGAPASQILWHVIYLQSNCSPKFYNICQVEWCSHCRQWHYPPNPV